MLLLITSIVILISCWLGRSGCGYRSIAVRLWRLYWWRMLSRYAVCGAEVRSATSEFIKCNLFRHESRRHVFILFCMMYGLCWWLWCRWFVRGYWDCSGRRLWTLASLNWNYNLKIRTKRMLESYMLYIRSVCVNSAISRSVRCLDNVSICLKVCTLVCYLTYII